MEQKKQMDELEEFLKKTINNTINYNIKKIKGGHVGNYEDVIKLQNDFNKTIMKTINQNNEELQEKIKLMETQLVDISTTVLKLQEQNGQLASMINSLLENKNTLASTIGFPMENDIILDNPYPLERCISEPSQKLNSSDIIQNTMQQQSYQNLSKLSTKNGSTSFNDMIQDLQNQEMLYKDLKIEDYDLDFDFIQKCLHGQSMQNDLKIFKKIYIDNVPCGYYSIRNIKKKYQYWLNGTMNNDDDHGTYIKDTLSSNIYNCYLKINNYDNYAEDIDQFVKNQEYILNLNEQKYKDKLFAQIIKIIQI
jgi:hypothetical protein